MKHTLPVDDSRSYSEPLAAPRSASVKLYTKSSTIKTALQEISIVSWNYFDKVKACVFARDFHTMQMSDWVVLFCSFKSLEGYT